MNPLLHRFTGAETIAAEFDARVPDPTDHWAQAQRSIDTYHPRRLDLRVREVITETASTRSFRLVRPSGEPLPPFLAGQYVSLEHGGTTRAYAISSSPTELGHYDLTVRRVPGGRVSNALIDTVGVGDTICISGPQGTFHHNPLFHGDDVVFLAGGSGVAPAMSMVRHIAAQGPGLRLHLLYGSRDGQDIIFRDELEQHAEHAAEISVDHVIGSLITAEVIEEKTGGLRGRMVYVCGPQAMYAHALDELGRLGHPRHRIRFEANGAPSRPADQADWPEHADPDGLVSVTARGRTFTTPRCRPLLDALEDNGVRPEAACRSGECSLCRVRVVAGEVHQADESRPRSCDARFGYVHACVAYPITDVTLEV